MAKVKKEAPKGWLHHATEDSVCLIINSKEYKDKLKDGYHKLMSDVLKERELLEEAKADETEGLTPVPAKVVELDDEALGKLYDVCDAELVKRGLLTVPEDDKEEGKDNAK